MDIPEFDLPDGFATALIGSNGAGKTTLINILTGVSLDYKGDISYFGQYTSKDRDEGTVVREKKMYTIMSICMFALGVFMTFVNASLNIRAEVVESGFSIMGLITNFGMWIMLIAPFNVIQGILSLDSSSIVRSSNKSREIAININVSIAFVEVYNSFTWTDAIVYTIISYVIVILSSWLYYIIIRKIRHKDYSKMAFGLALRRYM